MGKSVGDGVAHNIVAMLASVLQYLVPLALLAGSLVSYTRRRRQGELHERVAADSSADALEKMSWRQFEGLVAENFRRRGYRVIERGGDGPDGGVDLELYQGADKYLVQCKQWKATKVGVAIVRELYGVMAVEHAVGGFVVASGNFTDDAKDFVQGRSIELVDAGSLRSLIGGAPQVLPPAATTLPATPACPRCGSLMVQRTAKKGISAGKQFWGCSRFPDCTGTRT